MSFREIPVPNIAHVAAELVAATGMAPTRAAIMAARLCWLGKRFKRLTERLCGGEEDWGPQPAAQSLIERAEKRRDKLFKVARALLAEHGIPETQACIRHHNLWMKLETTRTNGQLIQVHEGTVLE